MSIISSTVRAKLSLSIKKPPITKIWIYYTARGVKALKLIITLIMLLLTSETSNGALSADMSEYVRKDVYDVQMQTLNANMERVLQKLDSLESKVNNMSDRITGLSARVDGIDSRMGDLRNDIYLWLVILGIVVGVRLSSGSQTVVKA